MLLAVFTFAVALAAKLAPSWAAVRQCYFPSWAVYRPDAGKFDVGNIDLNGCSVIDYAFGQITNNQLATFDWQDEKKWEALVQLRTSFPHIRIHLSVGGWTLSKQFPPMAGSAEGRKTFVDSAVKNLRKWNLDGLDVDWEYPEAGDRANFQSLIRELRQAFEADATSSAKPRLCLTAAVASPIKAGYVPEEMAKYLDMINVMTYDFHGAWEQKTGHNAPANELEAAMNGWANAGVPKSKLAVGLGFYGRTWTLSDQNNHGVGAPANGPGTAGTFTREGGILGYYEACALLKSGAKREWDGTAKVPYLVSGNQWISYDDVESITKKAQWTKDNGFAGVLIWDLSTDDFQGNCGPKNALLSAVNGIVKAIADDGSTTGNDEDVAWAASLEPDLLTAGPSDAEQESVEESEEGLAWQPHSRGEMLKPDGDVVSESDIST